MRRFKHEKTKRLGLKLSRLRLARFGTKPSGHFIGKFGPASRRRSTAHPFLLYRLALFYHLLPFIRESVLCRHPALWKSYFPQSKPLVTDAKPPMLLKQEIFLCCIRAYFMFQVCLSGNLRAAVPAENIPPRAERPSRRGKHKNQHYGKDDRH